MLELQVRTIDIYEYFKKTISECVWRNIVTFMFLYVQIVHRSNYEIVYILIAYEWKILIDKLPQKFI